jgi:type II secretory ATPase GspE/PulE/Tfp pilus assembly ATPase PilB-like protein
MNTRLSMDEIRLPDEGGTAPELPLAETEESRPRGLSFGFARRHGVVVEDLLETEDDAPIIRLINALLTEAIKENASDIHIEPFENRLVVRFRVDGVLREVLNRKRYSRR